VFKVLFEGIRWLSYILGVLMPNEVKTVKTLQPHGCVRAPLQEGTFSEVCGHEIITHRNTLLSLIRRLKTDGK
jgi:hypothetical protein